MRILLVFATMFFFRSNSQSIITQSEIELALGRNLHFVYFKPIIKSNLLFKDTTAYYKNLEGVSVETSILKQLISKSEKMDSIQWRDFEIRNYYVVSDSTKAIKKKWFKLKFGITNYKQYKKDILNYNLAKSYNKKLYFISRPVYSNDYNYATLEWDCPINGGGAVVLFKKNADGKWYLLTTIAKWKY